MHRVQRFLFLACLIAFAFGNQATAWEPPETIDSYYDLGGFHYNVTTSAPAAQTWFDRGLAMCIAFNHEEGVRCFERC